MRTETGQVYKLKDYKPTDFVVERIDLTFELDPKETTVVSRVILHRREGVAADAPLVFDGDELTLDSLQIDGNDHDPSLYDATPDSLTIRGLPESGPFEVTVNTTLSPDTNTKLMGLYRTNGVYCTQCEAEGFRRITYFYDRPDVLAVYTVTHHRGQGRCQAPLVERQFPRRRQLRRRPAFCRLVRSHPKPSYLFALVGGDLGLSNRQLHHHERTRSGAEASMSSTARKDRARLRDGCLKRSMKWDEEVFGREYDLDIFMIVAVSDFNMGAMENKGLNVFNDKYVLADPTPPPMPITPISKPSSRMSTSTTGPATASPAATGFSCA
jgi:aminopeptidase N